MFSIFSRNKKDDDFIALLLSDPKVREDLLGVGVSELPVASRIIEDAKSVLRFASSQDYRLFSKEVWARCIASLDVILDDRTSLEKLHFHRGSLRNSLDLLRVAAQARITKEVLEKDMQDVSPQR
jgi:hypothetical protein